VVTAAKYHMFQDFSIVAYNGKTLSSIYWIKDDPWAYESGMFIGDFRIPDVQELVKNCLPSIQMWFLENLTYREDS